jgi:hypothetical protein
VLSTYVCFIYTFRRWDALEVTMGSTIVSTDNDLTNVEIGDEDATQVQNK